MIQGLLQSYFWVTLIFLFFIFGCSYSGQRMIPAFPPMLKYLFWSLFISMFMIANGIFHVSLWVQLVDIPKFSISLLSYNDCAFAIEESQIGKTSTTFGRLLWNFFFISWIKTDAKCFTVYPKMFLFWLCCQTTTRGCPHAESC